MLLAQSCSIFREGSWYNVASCPGKPIFLNSIGHFNAVEVAVFLRLRLLRFTAVERTKEFVRLCRETLYEGVDGCFL